MIRDTWLLDIAADAPCGPDLQYDQAFLDLEVAARGKPEQQYGATIIPAEDPEWPGIVERAAGLLDRTRDLRVIYYYARGVTHTQGLRGLADALRYAAALIAKYWDQLHPALMIDGEPEPEMRMFALAGFADPDGVLRDARAADFLRTPAIQLTVRDVERIVDPKLGASDSGVGMDQLRASINDALAQDPGALGEPAAIVAAVTTIRTELLQHVEPAAMPELTPLASLMKPIAALVEELRAQAGAAGGEAAADGADVDGATASTGVARPVGDIRSRDDALKALDRVCDFLARSEPTNPAPLLIRRAQRLMTMPFMDIIRELAPEATSRVETITGTPAGN